MTKEFWFVATTVIVFGFASVAGAQADGSIFAWVME